MIASSPVQQLLERGSLWCANTLADAAGATMPTGFDALDAQLPGGGWPVGVLIELLQAPAMQGEWRLLLPALTTGLQGRVALVAPPHVPYAPGLAAQGLAPQRLLVVQADTAAERAWACEQALRCAGLCAVLAWLPQVRPEQLRRLQMAAHEQGQCLFVMRRDSARHEASPAGLRLHLHPGAHDGLLLHILKRRGPPPAAPLWLQARAPALLALLALAQGSHSPGPESAHA